jgi:hypothetical protein
MRSRSRGLDGDGTGCTTILRRPLPGHPRRGSRLSARRALAAGGSSLPLEGGDKKGWLTTAAVSATPMAGRGAGGVYVLVTNSTVGSTAKGPRLIFVGTLLAPRCCVAAR